MLRIACCLLVVLAAAACAAPAPGPDGELYGMTDNEAAAPPPLDPQRPIADRDCTGQIAVPGGNLLCR